MRIKQSINNKVNSFEFYCDLTKNNRLNKILELFQIDNAYVCLYGFDDKNRFNEIKTKIKINNIFIPSYKKNILPDLTLDIDVNEIPKFFSIINNDFDELVIWSKKEDWNEFIEILNKPIPCFTFFKTEPKKTNEFYLDFIVSDFNRVLIISDLSFHNSKYITKENMIDKIV